MVHFAAGERVEDGEKRERAEAVELVQTPALVVGAAVWNHEMLDDDEVLPHDLENGLVAEQVVIYHPRIKVSLLLSIKGRNESNE